MELNIEKTISLLQQKLNEYTQFVLFVHELPDCDAIGSAFAFKKWIELNFSNKDVRIAGITKKEIDSFPNFFNIAYLPVDVGFCKNSFGIIFDTANQERVLSHLNIECKETLRIDHHIKTQDFADFEYIDDTKSSTCEMVGLIFKDWNLKMDSTILQSLYFGLLTDTNRFLYDHTTSQTYSLMAWMSNFGFDKELVHNQLYLRNEKDAILDNKLFKKVKFKNGYATLFLSKLDNKLFKQKSFSGKVYLMANFKDVKVWTLVYYDENLKKWKGSIRSREYPVNLVANKFNGGGHRLASGFSLKKWSQRKDLEKEIQKLLTLENYE